MTTEIDGHEPAGSEDFDLGELAPAPSRDRPAASQPPGPLWAARLERLRHWRPSARTAFAAAVLSAVLAAAAGWQAGTHHARPKAAPVHATPPAGETLGDHSVGLDSGLDHVDAVNVGQTSGVSGATVTLTNEANDLREVYIRADGNPAFRLVGTPAGVRILQPGASLEIRLKVVVAHCNAVLGVGEWASSVVLDVRRPEPAPGDPAANDPLTDGLGQTTTFAMPELMLVPGGAAVERTCT